uniref:Protein-tyrosine-phosphatase n=1 Tax=Echinostoma caproni TaxID=27848 RepID=A0A183B466_9TREM
LLQKGVDGSFLARPSHSTPGSFTLSVRRGDDVTHIRIQNTDEFLDLYGGEKFATLFELVTYYMENEGQLKEKNGDLIKLKHPLICEDPTTERWFHGRITGKEAEKMLLEKDVYGCFLVRESVHRPGSYVLSVLTSSSQVAHIMIHGKPNGMYDVGGGHQFSSLKDLIAFYTNTPMVEKSGGLVSLKQPFNATRFNVSTIDERMRQLEQENGHGSGLAGFLEEFEELHQEAHTKSNSREEGSKYYNRDKNRYKNILPYDRTLVRLRDGDPKELGSDYINANYICTHHTHPPVLEPASLTNNPPASLTNNPSNGNAHLTSGWSLGSGSSVLTAGGTNSSAAFFFNGKPRYIATQGVLQSTQDSFWRMVWQERSAVIVMITKIVERDRNKCVCYWPTAEEGERIFHTYGHILRVKHVSERNSANYTLRQLLLTKEPVTAQNSSLESPECAEPSPLNRTGLVAGDHVSEANSGVVPPNSQLGSIASSRLSATTDDSNEENGFTVYHYHFTVWPDHGTPNDPSCVLDFMHDISARQVSIPLVSH